MPNFDVDLDDLVARLNNAFKSTPPLNSVGSNSSTMAAPRPVEYQLLRLYIDTIPHFDGNPNTLNIFIENCECLINTFSDEANPALNNFIYRAIIGRLTGRALTLVGPRSEFNTWTQVKNLLTSSFSDQRNIDCLEQDLIVLRPFKNETPYNFGMRCQDARSLLISKLNSLKATADKGLRIENYNKLALRTFIRGIPHPIQNNVRLRDPDTLEKAMALVIEEENFLYSQNRTNNLNSHIDYKPIQKNTPISYRPAQTPKLSYNPNMQQRSSVPNFSQNAPQFSNLHQLQHVPRFNPMPHNNSSAPPQAKPLWQPNTNFPTQRHPLFQQRQNQMFQNQNQSHIRPQFTNQSKPYKPEPMDTSSTRISKQAPPPKFQFQELYAQDIGEFENPFENNQTSSEGASALPSSYNLPDDYEAQFQESNYEYAYNDASDNLQFTQNEYYVSDINDVNFHQDSTPNNPT